MFTLGPKRVALLALMVVPIFASWKCDHFLEYE